MGQAHSHVFRCTKFIIDTRSVAVVGQNTILSTDGPSSPQMVHSEKYYIHHLSLTCDGGLSVCTETSTHVHEGSYVKIVGNSALSSTGQFVELIPEEHEMPVWSTIKAALPPLLDFDRSMTEPLYPDDEVDACYHLAYITLDHQAWRVSTDDPVPHKLIDGARKILLLEDVTFVLTLEGQLYGFELYKPESQLLLHEVIDILAKKRISAFIPALHAIVKDHRVVYTYEDCELATNIVPQLGDRLSFDVHDTEEVVIEW